MDALGSSRVFNTDHYSYDESDESEAKTLCCVGLPTPIRQAFSAKTEDQTTSRLGASRTLASGDTFRSRQALRQPSADERVEYVFAGIGGYRSR